MVMDFDAYERGLWAGRAGAYAGRFGRLTAHTAEALLDAARVTGSSDVLDVGTGPGTIAAAALARGANVSAIDADPQMVETAARDVPGLDVRVATLPELPFADAAGVPWPDDIPAPPFATHGEATAFHTLVEAADFAEVVVDELVWGHVVDPEDWWVGPLAGVGSTGVVINRQDPATIDRIKEAYDRLIAGFAIGGGRVRLPARALLAHATR